MNRRGFLGCAGCAGLAALNGCAVLGTRDADTAGLSAADNASLKPEDVSCCGIDCRSCDAYKATVHGDREARLRAAKVWTKTAQEHWGMKTLDPQVLDCAGCRVTEVKHHGHGRCPIKPCARKRGLASCGLCPEWRTCRLVGGVFADEPQARHNLERISVTAAAGAERKP